MVNVFLVLKRNKKDGTIVLDSEDVANRLIEYIAELFKDNRHDAHSQQTTEGDESEILERGVEHALKTLRGKELGKMKLQGSADETII